MLSAPIPKPPAEVLMGLRFYFEERGSPGFQGKLEAARAVLKRSDGGIVGRVVNDLTILLAGDAQTPGYAKAFVRYTKHCLGMDSRQLADYLRFLCAEFGVKPTVPVLIRDERRDYRL